MSLNLAIRNLHAAASADRLVFLIVVVVIAH
jgi:hypothetical protein